ncbi:MAG: preprotein translocase subunit SecG [Nitrospirota bacterium]
MIILLTIFHVIVCLFLIAVVLLQSGKGAELGAAFGGSSQTLFGGRGAATFLSKLTTFAAVGFMLTSLILAILTTQGSSVVKQVPVQEQQQSIPAQSGPVQQGTGAPVQSTPQPPAPAQSK